MADVHPQRGCVRAGAARRNLGWLAAGFGVAFAVPFLFADLLQLPRDLYYGIYVAVVLVFFVLWAREAGQRIDVMVRRQWVLAVVLGVACAVVLSIVVVRAEPPSDGPEGLGLLWAVLWRGVVYGAADGLLLSAFPILAVFAAADESRSHVTAVLHSYDTETFLPPHR